MRKLISLGLLALTLSLISSQVLAGQFPACEEMKAEYQAVGVYGLCNAWHNAKTVEAQNKFREKFAEIWDDELPLWLAGGEEGDEGQAEVFDCPCWAGVVLDDIDKYTAPMDSFLGTFGYASFVEYPYWQDFLADNSLGICLYDAYFVNNEGDLFSRGVLREDLDSTEAQTCWDEFLEIEAKYFP